MEAVSLQAKQAKLQALAQRVSSCRACPLHKTRTQAVPGSGNPNARIMLIGEAPGRNEDECGQPFVGMAGKHLNELLALAGLNREEVFISNVVKCRPPENRPPEKEEVAACAHFLKEQIALVNPKLVVCLGSTAAKAVLGLKEIGSQRGKLIERDGRHYFVCYHPAARFHRRKIAEDFHKLRDELKKVPAT